MRTEMVVAVIGVGSVVFGCAGPKAVGLRAIAKQGKDNELSVVHAYERQVLEIHGKVVSIAQSKRRGATVTTSPGLFGPVAGIAATHEMVPYVQLVPEDGAQDVYAYCFLDYDYVGQAAELKPGDGAALVGTFASYHHEDGMPILVLGDCRLKR